MPDLRLIGVHEDGLRLILAGPNGEHYTVAIDDALRTAARRDRPRMGQLQIEIDGGLRPREVQSLIRAGGSTEDVADRAGWSVDKVRRYEGPILAERAHVADQARLVRVRHRGGAAAGAAPTLQGRVAQRMRERGIDPDTSTSWDSARAPEATTWTVTLTFPAGGRQRQAVWTYDPVLRSVEPMDDEARWLSADDVVVAGPLPVTPPRVADVYDVEAEGGVAATTARRGATTARSVDRSADRPGDGGTEPVDLMTAMRQRTTVGRRSGRRRAEPRAEVVPALPLDGSGTDEPGRPDAAQPDDVEPDPQDHGTPGHDAADHDAADHDAADHDAAPGHDQPQLLTALGHESADESDDESDDESAEELDDLEPAGSEIPPVDEDPEPSSQEAGPEVDDELDRIGPADDTRDGAGPDDADHDPVADARAPQSKRRPRTSVPSWDDIMFGAKRD